MDFGRANLLTTNRLHWLPFFLGFLSFEDRTNRALLTALIYVKALFIGIYATRPLYVRRSGQKSGHRLDPSKNPNCRRNELRVLLAPKIASP